MNIKLLVFLVTLFTSQLSFGQIKIEDLKIDTNITGFHFAANFQGTIVYTPNGKADIGSQTKPSAFSISILPNATPLTARLQIEQFLSWSVKDGYQHTDVVNKDTIVNGTKLYSVSLTETLKGTEYKNRVFHGFFIKDNSAVIFISGDLDNGKYIEGFEKTFYRITM